MDRVADFESVGWEFESLAPHQEPCNHNNCGVFYWDFKVLGVFIIIVYLGEIWRIIYNKLVLSITFMGKLWENYLPLFLSLQGF